MLSNGLKRHWGIRVLEGLEHAPDVRLGVAEFILSWATKQVYSDLEWLVSELVMQRRGRGWLEVVASEGNRLGSLRADALLKHLSLGHRP